MPETAAQNYRLGALYAVTTAFLLSTQEPFSFLAARRLDWEQFILVTQVSLLLSIPLLNFKPSSRRDFIAILSNPAMYPKLAVIFALGMAGLLLYKVGLTGAHPIIIAAIFNLSPFWAAMVARLISGVSIPVAPATFLGCLAAAFLGAMAVAWSQLGATPDHGDLLASFLRGSWVFAIPIPILSALNGTLIGKWFADYEESASIAVNFLVPAAVLIPFTVLSERGGLAFSEWPAILLMMFGTIVAASLGRVLYQVALTTTGNDNGYVTMFFLLVPALTGLVSLPLSLAIPELKFYVNPIFFLGLALIAAALLLFSFKSWREERARGANKAPRAAH
jgi:hypothetical protein